MTLVTYQVEFDIPAGVEPMRVEISDVLPAAEAEKLLAKRIWWYLLDGLHNCDFHVEVSLSSGAGKALRANNILGAFDPGAVLSSFAITIVKLKEEPEDAAH